jgi:hypothetical protein
MNKMLHKTFKAVLLSSILFVLASSLYAKPMLPKNDRKILADTSWIAGPELKGVKAYYKFSVCDSNQVVLLKFVNSNTYSVKISWTDQVKISGEATPRRLKTFSPVIVVDPGELANYTCSNMPVPELASKLFIPQGSSVESFIFSNISISNN